MAATDGVPTIAEMALERAKEGLATTDIELIGRAVVTLCEREVLRERAACNHQFDGRKCRHCGVPLKL